MSLPTGSEFVTEKKNRLWPHCLRVIVTIVLLVPKAHKFTNGQNFTVLTSHDVSGIFLLMLLLLLFFRAVFLLFFSQLFLLAGG